MIRVLLIGPFSPPITGVSLANDIVFKNLSKDEGVIIDRINNSYPTFKEDLGKFSISKIWFYFKQYFMLYKVLRVEIIYLTLGQTFFGIIKYAPYVLVAKVLKKKIVIHIHGNFLRTEYERQKGIKKQTIKYLVSKADKGIVLSELLIPNLSPFLPNKDIYILHNFVEDYLIDSKKYIINSKDTDTLKIIYLSNLMTEKGILDLLTALKTLSEKKVYYEAKIAGNIDPAIKENVLSQINSNKAIEYLGVVKGDGKKRLLEWANTFVFPSYYAMEGQPISLLEAMATANIILTTKHAGIPDVFSTKNGFYINKKDPKDIEEKLEYIADNLLSLQAMMKENLKYASSAFTEENFINSLKTIFLK